MNVMLEPNDIRVIRGILKGQKVVFALSLYLTLTFGVCSIACLSIAVADNVSPAFLLLGFGTAILTYFLLRATHKNWKQVIYPLRSALHFGTNKNVVSGKLGAVFLSGKGEVTYEIDGSLTPTYPVLLDYGFALFPESLHELDALLYREVSLHLLLMPDGRQLLLDTRYTAHELDKNASTFRVRSRARVDPGISRYFFYTLGYILLLFVVLFVVPIGMILGFLPVTVGYVIVLRNEMKRQRNKKKQHIAEEISGTITEVIKTSARIQVLGVPTSNNYDTWFRVDGKPYLIKSDEPLPPAAVGDTIQLVLV